MGGEGSGRQGEEWIDGPGLVDWIHLMMGWETEGEFNRIFHGLHPRGRYRGPLECYRGSAATIRRLTDWQGGTRANIYAADKALIDLGLHLSRVPEDLWRKADCVEA